MNKPTITPKTQATKTANVPAVTAPSKANGKANVPAVAPKAPSKKVATVPAAPTFTRDDVIAIVNNAIVQNVAPLQAKYDAVLSHCDNLTKVIVSLQTTIASLSQPSQPSKVVEKSQPQTSQPSIESDSFDAVLTQSAEWVRENHAADFFNEKVYEANLTAGRPSDLRCYLKTAQNRTLKIAAKTAGISLSQLSDMLSQAVNG